MKNKRALLVMGILLAFFIGVLCVNQYFRTRVFYNENTVNGNTGPNLYNEGLFCEYDGVIYFSNPSDSGALYSMNTDGSDLKKLSNDRAWYINVDDHYIYYARNNYDKERLWGLNVRNEYGLCRMDHNGKNSKNLDSAPCMGVSLIGNSLYYFRYEKETASQLYRIDIDGKNRELVSETPIWAVASNGDSFYYSGVDADHDIHVFSTVNDSKSIVLPGNYYQPSYVDGYLYYINLNDGYTLCRMNMATGQKDALIRHRIDAYNVSGNVIYYQVANEAMDGIYAYNMNLNTNTLLMAGHFCGINVAGNKVYFHEFEDYDTYYVSDASASYVTAFLPGAEG